MEVSLGAEMPNNANTRAHSPPVIHRNRPPQTHSSLQSFIATGRHERNHLPSFIATGRHERIPPSRHSRVGGKSGCAIPEPFCECIQ